MHTTYCDSGDYKMLPPFVLSDTTDQPSSVVCPASKEVLQYHEHMSLHTTHVYTYTLHTLYIHTHIILQTHHAHYTLHTRMHAHTHTNKLHTFKCRTAGSKGGGGLVIIVGGATRKDTALLHTPRVSLLTFSNFPLFIISC